jgi:hypothetical protein
MILEMFSRRYTFKKGTVHQAWLCGGQPAVSVCDDSCSELKIVGFHLGGNMNIPNNAFNKDDNAGYS